MNVLFTRFPLLSAYGGAEMQTMLLAEGLRERGHNIQFLGNCRVLCDEMTNNKFSIIKPDIGPPPVTKWAALSFLWRKKKMQNLLIDHLQNPLKAGRCKPQAIFMLSLSEKLLLTSYAVAHGINVFWIEHDTVGRWLTWNPWLPNLRKLSKNVTTIAVSELSRKIYLDLGWEPEKVIAIPNGVHSPSPTASGRAAGRGRPLRIGCVSRLSPEKGIDLLIESIQGLPNVSLTIVGRGKEEKNLRNLIRRVTSDKQRVTLISWIDDLSPFYQSIDVFVLPSRAHDPFGLVAAEAMMHGIPVIVTDVCGIADYLHDGMDAIVVHANSPSVLKKVINRMLNVECRMKIAKNGQKTAMEKFGVEKMVDAYENILQSNA